VGLRGPIPKPTGIKVIEGNPGRRPLPREPNFAAGIPARPKKISRQARVVWNNLVAELAPSGILRIADQRALWQLAEDEALLAEAYAGIWKTIHALEIEAKSKGQTLPGGAAFALLSMKSGRMAMNSIGHLAARTITERREFGLTPSARTRFDADSLGAAGERGSMDPLEMSLCG